MSPAIDRTPFMLGKGRGDKCCPGPKSCLPHARPVLGASVIEWHKAVRWVSQGTEAGMVAKGCGCAHCFSPKLRQPRHHFSVGLKGCRQQHLSPTPFIKKINNNMFTKGNRLFFNYRCTRYHIIKGADVH